MPAQRLVPAAGSEAVRLGARHESEGYVCLLLDSLKRGYPIGGVVLWETSTPVPYREFVRDYAPGHHAHQVEAGAGVQPSRLCTTGSSACRRFTQCCITASTGVYCISNMLFDADTAESDDTGFSCSGMV